MTDLKRLLIIALEFMAGLAGNLIAGWIQQGIWSSPFTPARIAGTIIGAGLTLLAIVWLDRRGERESDKISAITGNVLAADGNPIKGALVFVEGVDRQKETDSIGWFRIEVDEQEAWVVRASYQGQTTQAVVTRDDFRTPTCLIFTDYPLPKGKSENEQSKVTLKVSEESTSVSLLKAGDLLWYQHGGWQDGTRKWSGKTIVGNGWDAFRFLFPGGVGIIYAVKPDGILLWYQHTGWRDGRMLWKGKTEIGSGWNEFKFLFSGGEGAIYAVV